LRKTIENGWKINKEKEHPAEIDETNFDDSEDE
jgi:hypothetical protein